MRKILMILFMLISCKSFNQVTKISYGLQYVIDENKIINKARVEKFKSLNEVLNDISFDLVYNNSMSKFYTDMRMDSGNEEIKQAINFSGIGKPIYCYKGGTYEYGSDNLIKEKDFLVRSEMIANWKLHKDTLVVNGYKCYKATHTYTNDTENTFTDIAWYCPAIPGNFGPYGTGNLPGAILIYQHANSFYKVKSIQFNVKEKIEFPDNLKVITMQEYDALWKKWEEEEFGRQ